MVKIFVTSVLLIFFVLSGCHLSKNCSTEMVVVTGLEKERGRTLVIGKVASISKESCYISFNCQHGQFKIFCSREEIMGKIAVGDNIPVVYYLKHKITKSDARQSEKTIIEHICVEN